MSVFSKKWLFFLFILSLFAVTAHAEGPRRMVASTTQIADFAKNITGDRWEVISILAPGADPHTYTPTPRDAERVAQADLILQNGLMLEGKNWMATLAKASGKPLVTCTDGITPLEISEDGDTMADPHAWFSPKNAAVYMRNILQAVVAMDPEGKDLFQARADLYLQQLRVLDAWIRAQVAQIPEERRLLVTSHDAFNYFCREYRFNPQNNYLSRAPGGWSTGGEVGAGSTPARLRQVMESIRAMGARAIFVETSVNPRQIREIAAQTGIRVGGALYSDAMGPPGSAGESYIGMMRENTLTIVEALR